MKFVDSARIRVKAGGGGVGCVSFRREKFVPKGGPDGGNGGRGGDVIIRTNRHLNTLLDYQYKRNYTAPRGQHGLGSNKTGKSGESIALQVPPGTLIRDGGIVIADLINDGVEIVIAKGGRGGKGNAEFATSTNQAPREYELGEEGEGREIDLELKLLADVGLVGLPNAGKSTLISVISAAKPKIADYPFTTLVPNLGIVRIDEAKSFVVADIPGLIEGAHLGKGLGIQFLRHIERTKVLVFLVEATSEHPKEDYRILRNELKLFDKKLLNKPKIIALTKTDITDEKKMKSIQRLRFSEAPTLPVSAVTGNGIRKLTGEMWKAVRSSDAEMPQPLKRQRKSQARKENIGSV